MREQHKDRGCRAQKIKERPMVWRFAGLSFIPRPLA
jgi:hypothetical protein